METSIDMIFEPGGEGSLDSLLPPPDFPERPPDDCLYCIDTILPWAIGITAVGTVGYLSWRLINKHNQIPPSI